MKVAIPALVLASAASTAMGLAHSHNKHRHLHKRADAHAHAALSADADLARRELDVIDVKGPVVSMYKFGEDFYSEEEVCRGINNGTFVWAKGTKNAPDCEKIEKEAAQAKQAAATSSPKTEDKAPVKLPVDQAVSPAKPKSDPTPDVPSKPVGDSVNTSSIKGISGVSGLSGMLEKIASNANVDRDFPDGELDCSHFPEDYGAIPIDWMGLGGFTGVQLCSVSNGAISSIDTAVNGQGCKNPGDGRDAYCSYSCPPGYQKSQWPEQNAGTSVGGLVCKSDNKLYLTNPGLSKKICIQGSGLVSVVNKLDEPVAICRTDYPGTENEVVPLFTQPGEKYPLTCPEANSYFKHLGDATSAQYYINQKGLPVTKACSWGDDDTSAGDAYGNWAPMNLGVGTGPDGKTFISLLSTEQNKPTKVVSLGFNVELMGDFGGSKCFYTVQNGVGQYCTAGTIEDPQNCQQQGQYSQGKPVPGCTVEIYSGTATYVLS